MKAIIDQQKQYFNSNVTKPVNFRIEQLKRLRAVVKSYEQELTEAVYNDYGKGKFNTYLTEFTGVYGAIDKAIKKMRK